ncbi:MAG TPA: hypothetical protein VKQ32_21240 [Polyangia bacterium]|nr:hypothetical protein [Polyangia bacterium]
MPPYRIIESPTVHARYTSGPEAGQPKPPFEGTRLGQRFVGGRATVDEEAMWPYYDPLTFRDSLHRVWHLLVMDFQYADVTPDDQPPKYPLPTPETAVYLTYEPATPPRTTGGRFVTAADRDAPPPRPPRRATAGGADAGPRRVHRKKLPEERPDAGHGPADAPPYAP